MICKLILGSSLNGSLMSTLGEFSVNKFLLTPLDVHLLHSVEAELLKTTFMFLPSNSPSLYVDFLFADNKWEQIPPNQLRKYDVFSQIDPILRDVLYLTAVLNSCINPFIYGVYYLTGVNVMTVDKMKQMETK